MRRTIAILACALALCGVASTVAPSPSFASADAQTHTYYTTMTQTQPLPSGGAIVGTMTLSVSDDGIINGWYIPQDAGSPVEVTGRMDGSDLRLEIGSMGSLRIDGAKNENGTIVGTATQYPSAADYGTVPPSFSFIAKPSR